MIDVLRAMAWAAKAKVWPWATSCGTLLKIVPLKKWAQILKCSVFSYLEHRIMADSNIHLTKSELDEARDLSS